MNNRITKTLRAKAGFTLVELIVVIAILGILAGVGTVGYSGYIKKANEAADQQLLGFVNQAFAAACIENGDDINSLTSATLTLDTDNTVKSVDDKYNDVFMKYFAGNENTAFKVFTKIEFDSAKHVFVGNSGAATLSDIVNTILNTVKGSSFEGSEAEIIGDIQSLTNAVKAVANANPTLVKGMLGGAFGDYLDANAVDTDNPQAVANYATLFLANQVAGLTDSQKQAISDVWKNNTFDYSTKGNVMDGVKAYMTPDTGLSTMGAMALFYANAEACVQNMENTYNPTDDTAKAQKQAVIDAFKGVSTTLATSEDTDDVWNALKSGYEKMVDAADRNPELMGVIMNYGSTNGDTDAAAFTNTMTTINSNQSTLKDLTGSENMYGDLTDLLGGD